MIQAGHLLLDKQRQVSAAPKEIPSIDVSSVRKLAVRLSAQNQVIRGAVAFGSYVNSTPRQFASTGRRTLAVAGELDCKACSVGIRPRTSIHRALELINEGVDNPHAKPRRGGVRIKAIS